MPDASGPLQVTGQVLGNGPAGAYRMLTVAAPGIAARFRPGQFVALAVGGEHSAMLARRAFSIHDTVTNGSAEGFRIVFAVHGRGTAWLAGLGPGDPLDAVGPLGQPFTLSSGYPASAEDFPSYSLHDLPRERASGRCVLVGGGYGSAPLFALADRLRRHGCSVDFVLGASSADRVFGADRARRTGTSTTVTTVDGSLGERGVVTDVLPPLLAGAGAVYACGPMAMLRAVTGAASEYGVPAQVAVEESMACGIGVCMTCVLPVVGDDGVTRMTRCCIDGPVFSGDAVRWQDIGTVPEDAVGART